MTEGDLWAAAEVMQEGTGWKLGACARREGRWELHFAHERGDHGVVAIDEKAVDEVALLQIRNFVTEPLCWPDWKRDDPVPRFELSLPWSDEDVELACNGEKLPVIANFEPGMTLDVVMVDLNRAVVTLVPRGPWCQRPPLPTLEAMYPKKARRT